MGLFYPNKSNSQLIGYADAGYLSDPHKGQSQIGYLFTCGNIAISWRFVKQSISATCSNLLEIIAIHEVSSELAKIGNSTYSRKIWIILNQR